MTQSKFYNELDFLTIEFTKAAQPQNSPIMAKYMKDLFPFIGVSAVPRKVIFKEWKKSCTRHLNPIETRELVKLLYAQNQREYHYIAIELVNSWKKSEIMSSDSSFLTALITTNSWWDSVDAIASNYLGKYIQLYPEQGADLIEEWRYSENLWLRRSCLIYQLKYGNTTDFTMMMDLINQFKNDKQFFIQKAIGWSLRQYSKYQPEAVRDFLQDSDLIGLARKEAEKYL
jgi:3-methyladenine DNA glycosylase AlkD